MIEELATRALKMVMAREGLPKKYATLSPQAVPTLWNQAAYSLGRMVRNAGGTRVNPSDAHDHDHYAAARYTDLLVTDDKEFRETAALIEPMFPAITFNDFFENRCGPVVSFDAPSSIRPDTFES